jgi:membrane protease YdiL (CAAX protease family)
MPFLVAIVVLGANLAANRLAPGAHLLIGIAVAPGLALIARAAGLTRAELGLGRWRDGLRRGGIPALALAAGYGLLLVVPPARDVLERADGQSWPAVVLAVLLVIPVGTVLAEELAFRGVLWALVRRRAGTAAATAISSVLFGLWHVLPALGAGPANEIVGGATAVRVAATVVVTGIAGVGFCWLRVRSGSLLAPALLHWAINGLGLLAVQVA